MSCEYRHVVMPALGAGIHDFDPVKILNPRSIVRRNHKGVRGREIGPLVQELAVLVEDLDARVLAIGNVEPAA